MILLLKHIVLIVISSIVCKSSFMNTQIPITNFTLPSQTNCTQNMMKLFDRLRNTIHTIKSASIHQIVVNKPTNPFCIVPEIQFNYTFMPDFYCPSMQQKLYCNKTEEFQYLHKFYHSLGGDNWINNRYWLNTTDYCNWYGIYCCNTSYPLYQTCINIIWMDNNNLSGILPSPWLNSSVLTIFSASHNHITGTIPDYHNKLPNLSLFAINPKNPFHPKTDSLFGVLPTWPLSGCMAWFDVHNMPYLTGNIPKWNKPLKYIIYIAFDSTSLIGTLPEWTHWQWPYQLTIANQLGNLTGTIPPFTNAKCPTLERLYLYDMSLTGTMPPLPPQIYDRLYDPTVFLNGNELYGTFPWYSLDQVVYLTLQDNKFTGNIVLPSDYDHFVSINISNNMFDGMFPCLMKNNKLQFVDARFNKFDSIATDKENYCNSWPNTLGELFLSNNKIVAEFDRVVRNATNLTVIDFGNNRLKGTVPSSLVEGAICNNNTHDICNCSYVSFYDNDFSCTFPDAGNRQFNESWIYIGNGMKRPWAQYTNQYEKGLGIIAIAPIDELRNYMILPLTFGVSLFTFYVVWICSSVKIKLIRMKSEDEKYWYIRKNSTDKILYIMQQSVSFVGYLSIIAVLMIIVYTLGANFYKCGYYSLQPTITYMGVLNGYYDSYSWISIVLFFIYSSLCTWFVVKIMYLAKFFAKKPIDNVVQQSGSNVDNDHQIGGSLLIVNTLLINNSSEGDDKYSNNLVLDHDLRPIQSINSEIQKTLCKRISFWLWWTTKFIIFVIIFAMLLFGPIIAYNIYHSIPYTHMRYIPELNTELFQNFVIYILPFLLAVTKFFGIPFANDTIRELLIEANIVDVNKHNIWRNWTICIIRWFIMIILPITILFIFDDGCLQNWKSWWDYCDTDISGDYIHPQCELIINAYNIKRLPSSPPWVCHAVCDQHFVPYRCMRRFFEVLGPLYLYKMNIALWFPLLYFIKQTKIGKRFQIILSNCFKRFIQIIRC
eukprot:339638_1